MLLQLSKQQYSHLLPQKRRHRQEQQHHPSDLLVRLVPLLVQS